MKKGILFIITTFVLFSIGVLSIPTVRSVLGQRGYESFFSEIIAVVSPPLTFLFTILIFIAATLVGLGVAIFFGEDKEKA